MKPVAPVILLLLLPIGFLRADTHNAASCALADVQAAIAAASPGDTVLVPPGEAIWDQSLVISKGIILKGDETVIKGNMGLADYIIQYIPNNPAANEPFRLTGFTLDSNNNALMLKVFNKAMDGVVYPINRFRVDHNTFLNCRNQLSGNNLAPFLFQGTIYGVIDNNTFSGSPGQGAHTDNNGLEEITWRQVSFTPGKEENLYYEDNIFNTAITADSGGRAGQYCKRYNEYNTLASLYPMFDAHGNQSHGVYTHLGVEIYGNLVNAGSFNVNLLDHRGGKALLFFNKIITTGSAYAQIREEYLDAISPPAFNPLDGTPQHVNSSYYFNNRKNSTLFNPALTFNCGDKIEAWQAAFDYGGSYCFTPTGDPGGNCWRGTRTGTAPYATGLTEPLWSSVSIGSFLVDGDYTWLNMGPATGPALVENRDFWLHETSFTGDEGVGCGPLANRPTACTPGVGYWATPQDCSMVDGKHIGPHPIEPIRGTLYICSAPNVWTAYYTPFTYPHPLRTSGPLADTFLTITAPNGGEVWRRGESCDITWTASGISGNLVIELLQGNEVLGTIASSVDAAAGTYTWVVGRLENGSFLTGTNLTIRISTTTGTVLAEQHIGSQ